MFGGAIGNVCQHYEWASGRKIDAATNVNGDVFRNLVSQARAGDLGPKPPLPPPPEDDDMIMYVAKNQATMFLSGGRAAKLTSGDDIDALAAKDIDRVTLAHETYIEWNDRFYGTIDVA